MSHRANLSDLIVALSKNMTDVEIAQTAMSLEIGRVIRAARKKCGWTQKRFAAEMKVNQSLVSRWESGNCNYTIDTLVQISHILGLSMQCPFKSDNVLVDSTIRPVKRNSSHTVILPDMKFSNSIYLDFSQTSINPAGGAA